MAELPYVAVALPQTSPGVASYTLRGDEVLYVEAIAVDCQNTSGATVDVWARMLNMAGLLIVGQLVGNAQATGTTVTYSLSPYLNPCDMGSSTALSITPDVFGGVTLVAGCQVLCEARSPTTGAIATGASMLNGSMWVQPAAGGADVIPLLTPLSPQDQAGAIAV